MKQKKETDSLGNREQANFSEVYEVAPLEDPEHLKKVNAV